MTIEKRKLELGLLGCGGYEIKGHKGRWYIISETYWRGQKVYLMESELFGEDAPAIIVDNDVNIIMDDVTEGFDELYSLEPDWKIQSSLNYRN